MGLTFKSQLSHLVVQSSPSYFAKLIWEMRSYFAELLGGSNYTMGVNSSSVFSRTTAGLQVMSVPFLPLLLATYFQVRSNLTFMVLITVKQAQWYIGHVVILILLSKILNGARHKGDGMLTSCLKTMNF